MGAVAAVVTGVLMAVLVFFILRRLNLKVFLIQDPNHQSVQCYVILSVT